MGAGILAAAKRGSALALPLLLLSLAGLVQADQGGVIRTEEPHIDGGARYIAASSGNLDAAAQLVGAPAVGGQWLLWGGGMTLTKPQIRLQASAWEGGLRAQQGSLISAWDLQLAELALEQTYAQGPCLITAGVTADHGELFGRLVAPGGASDLRAPLWGGGFCAGVRWPRDTKMGFLVRANYLWLSGQGDWQGDQAGALGGQKVDLGGAGATGQLELSF
jgi:hypothetical protein